VDARGGSHAVQIAAARVFDPRVELRYHAQNLFGAFKSIEKGEGAFPAYRQRHQRAWKEHGVPDWKDRKILWIKFGCHNVPLALPPLTHIG
jgi:hypothetical protein